MVMLDTLKMTRWQEEENVAVEERVEEQPKIVVYNDDVNTFDWVIECFVKVCQHNTAQAEQLSYIIHFNGKATVKTGSMRELTPVKEALQERGLSAVIEQ
jgi:ATP-dependent Clp protease adaptor protein ClpS